MDRSAGSLVNEEDTNDTEDTKLAGHTQPTVVQRMAPKYTILYIYHTCQNTENTNTGHQTNSSACKKIVKWSRQRGRYK